VFGSVSARQVAFRTTFDLPAEDLQVQFYERRSDTFGKAIAVATDMVERREITDRRTLLGGGRRDTDAQPNDPNGCMQTAQQVARLRTVVETIAPAMQQHAEAVRSLVNAVQGLTAQHRKR
jgi:hypothetical protein